MKTSRHPVLATVLWGFAGGLCCIGFNLIISVMPFPFDAVRLALWLSVAGYGVLLSHWSRQALKSVLFPLFFLSLAVYLVPSVNSVFLLALVGVSWIRSGICFPPSRGLKIWIELLLCLVGAGMVRWSFPATPVSWALAIWLFFLLQSTYFILLDQNPAAADRHQPPPDTFDQSSRQAMAVLARAGVE